MLNSDLVGPILVALPQVVGCESVANAKNIPVVCKYAQAFLSTCKAFHEEGRKTIVIDNFIRAVAIRFQVEPERVAAIWKAEPGRIWFWRYIQDEKLDLVYQRIQEIYQIALQMKKEVGGPYSLPDSLQRPKGQDYLTGKELVLTMNRLPRKLDTPFGMVPLFKPKKASQRIVNEVSTRFLQALGAPSLGEKAYVITLTNVQPLSTWKGVLKKESWPREERERYLQYLGQMVETKGEGPKIEKKNIPPIPLFNTIENVVKWFSEITDQLACQPRATRKIQFEDKRSKELWCELTNIATYIEDPKNRFCDWHFENGCMIVDSPSDALKCIDRANVNAGLKKGIEALQSNWVSANIEDYKNMFYHMESEEEWNLYIKKEGFAWGKQLFDFTHITSLAKTLGLADSITCGRLGANPVKGVRPDLPYIYLWVRKDRLKEVKMALGLQLRDIYL